MDESILFGARVLNGLLAGVYAAFLLAVMPALHGLPDDVFARVMNRINEVIVNPVFLLLFLGAPLLAGVVLVWHRSPFAIAAAVCAVAALVITFAANLPLNDALAAGGSRQAYETPWLVWHSVRTFAATGAFVLVGLAGRVSP